MTTRTRSRIYVSIAAMILTAALAVPAAAQQQVPFKGTFQGKDAVTPGPSATTVVSPQPPRELAPIWVNSHSPRSYGKPREHCPPGLLIGSRPMETASIRQFVGSAELSDNPDYLKVTEIHTITGGTGRFTGAQGSFTVDRIHILVPLPGWNARHLRLVPRDDYFPG